MPALFALGVKVIGKPELALFAGFGSFAMLLLVDFGGPVRGRLEALGTLGVAGAGFVCLGTLASQNVWVAAAAMFAVGFGVIFIGVLSSALAGATTSLLLAFILPVSLAAPASAIPDRVAGWAMAAAASLIAVGSFWPAPDEDPLRSLITDTCRALARRLRADVSYAMSGGGDTFARDRDSAVELADRAVAELHSGFLATPYRPTTLGTSGRALVSLVDQLIWLNALAVQCARSTADGLHDNAAAAVRVAAAEVLEQGAELLGKVETDGRLDGLLAELRRALQAGERHAADHLPVSPRVDDAESSHDHRHQIEALVGSLNPGFRAQELGFATTLVGEGIEVAVAAERRSWLERLLGRQPRGATGPLAAARIRAGSHLNRNSVWLHNSLRGAAGLGLAVFVANRTGVQHSFWVVLGTLSVLRSNALSTGQNIVRGLSGTVAGFIVGAALLALIGSNTTLLWLLLPPVILLAGVTPAVISFAAGQAAFTLTLVFLFNIIQPVGWRIGLLRVEDVALGCAVSLVVGLLFWPRGARVALRRALGEAYADTAHYLTSAVEFGMARRDAEASASPVPGDGERAAGSARRLDDTFRNYLAERGAKPVPLPEITALINGVGGLRLAADAVLDLWRQQGGAEIGQRVSAQREILERNELLRAWYEDLATSLLDGSRPPEPAPQDVTADKRLVDAVQQDLTTQDAGATATAVRVIWTGDHLDAARRLQQLIVGSARVALTEQLPSPGAPAHSGGLGVHHR
jgi:uncharacterized membrane protein YccC